MPKKTDPPEPDEGEPEPEPVKPAAKDKHDHPHDHTHKHDDEYEPRGHKHEPDAPPTDEVTPAIIDKPPPEIQQEKKERKGAGLFV